MLKIGRLRHRVTIQSATLTQSATTGAMTPTWGDVATVWASIEPISAKEFAQSGAEVNRITTRIIIRYRPDVSEDMRLYHPSTNTYYNIEGILTDKDSNLEYLTLPCSTGVKYE